MEQMAALFSSIAFTPVIVLTAADPKQYREQALKTNAAAFFQKPVNSKVLLDTVNKILEQPSWKSLAVAEMSN